MKRNRIFILGLILFFGFIIRVITIDFPFFTSEEARLAYRGYTLATKGKDELGRKFPLLFNSQEDYQFPLTSYLTASGELIFGKSDFGVRLPFIILGVLLIFLVFKISEQLNSNLNFHLLNVFLIASSPVLIYLSRVPNEIIVLTDLFTTLYYYLNRKSQNIAIVTLLFILTVLTSKIAFFILLPFVIFTLYQQKEKSKTINKLIVVFCIGIVAVGLIIFFTNPQAKRSFLENNFSIVADLTVTNGVNTLRGEGLQSSLHPLAERALFSKLNYIPVGFIHWLSYFNPALFFGQLDSEGKINFPYLGAFTEVLIFPLLLGVVLSIKWEKRILAMFPYFIIMTFPAFFSYPKINLELLVLILPFIIPIIALGLVKMSKIFVLTIIFLVIFEVASSLFNIPLEVRKAASVRTYWIRELVEDIFESSKSYSTVVSDTVTPDIAPYIQWFSSFNPKDAFLDINSPYKYIQYDLGRIKVINSETRISKCLDKQYIAYLGERDLNKIKSTDIKIHATYGTDNRYVSVLLEKVCLD